jgi:hypothetical protein
MSGLGDQSDKVDAFLFVAQGGRKASISELQTSTHQRRKVSHLTSYSDTAEPLAGTKCNVYQRRTTATSQRFMSLGTSLASVNIPSKLPTCAGCDLGKVDGSLLSGLSALLGHRYPGSRTNEERVGPLWSVVPLGAARRLLVARSAALCHDLSFTDTDTSLCQRRRM